MDGRSIYGDPLLWWTLLAFVVCASGSARWSARGAIAGLLGGCLLAVLIWAGLAAASFMSSGAASSDFKFVLWAGLLMVAGLLSGSWLVVGCVGAAFGLTLRAAFLRFWRTKPKSI